MSFADIAIINHPVHILSDGNEQSPSAFIPFCEFGGDMLSMGIKTKKFPVPVCNSFQAKVLNDQLCYEVDLSKFSHKHNIIRELKSGFAFIMDYNEDRTVKYEEDMNIEENIGLVSSVVEMDQNNHAFIYINSIGT